MKVGRRKKLRTTSMSMNTSPPTSAESVDVSGEFISVALDPISIVRVCGGGTPASAFTMPVGSQDARRVRRVARAIARRRRRLRFGCRRLRWRVRLRLRNFRVEDERSPDAERRDHTVATIRRGRVDHAVRDGVSLRVVEIGRHDDVRPTSLVEHTKSPTLVGRDAPTERVVECGLRLIEVRAHIVRVDDHRRRRLPPPDHGRIP